MPALGLLIAAPNAAASPARTSVSSSPALYPDFRPRIFDYVVRCTGDPLKISFRAPHGISVTVDGRGPFSGSFTRSVRLRSGQAFPFQTRRGKRVLSYHVRCLPPDFPQWMFQRLQTPRQQFYAVTPTLNGGPPYVILYDVHGVPIWWFRSAVSPSDAKLLGGRTLAWALTDGSGYELRRLNGKLKRKVSMVGVPTDSHDLQRLPNGDFLMVAYKPRDDVDLSAFGGSAQSTVTDAEIQEINPNGQLVWSWNSKDHIGLEETGRWWPLAISGFNDIVHINSVEPDGKSLIISLRHTDGVYSIDRATGNVQWKLGGTSTPQSLTVLDDPYGDYPLGGQHDARVQPGGYLTIHDNGTLLGRGPRAVRYKIDPSAGTATLVESIADPDVPISICCGSARRSASGSWLMSWGFSSLVTEFAPDGRRTFRLTFGSNASSYRAFPIAYGRLPARALRAGMTAMHPRPRH